jgi:Putative adhesin
MFSRMQAVFVLSTSLLTGLAHAEKYEQRLPVQPHGMVEISNVAGRIDVQGWDNPEVEVRGEIGEGVEKVDFATDHGHTIIKVRVPNHSFHSASADLRIRVPRDSELDISGVSSEVVVNNVEGELMAKTVSGNVRTDVFGRDAEIKTVSGDVSLRGNDKGEGEMHITTISGNIHVDRAGGDLEASTVSGDMTLRLSPSHSIRLRSTSGDIGFEGKLVKGGNIDAETVSGSLNVRASHDGSLEYQVNTFSGDIRNCMGLDSERVSKYGPGRRLNGTRGEDSGDEARIRLKTMSGDVELCDKR